MFLSTLGAVRRQSNNKNWSNQRKIREKDIKMNPNLMVFIFKNNYSRMTYLR